jgi:hypothetical protein
MLTHARSLVILCTVTEFLVTEFLAALLAGAVLVCHAPGRGGAEMSRTQWILAAAMAIVAAIAIAVFLMRGTPAVARPEDGLFANDCCGEVALDKGRIVLGGQRIGYEIGRDGQGPFILPSRYVGPYEDRGFEVDGTRPALKLRPDTLPRPESIAMEAYGKIFVFRRARPRAR